MKCKKCSKKLGVFSASVRERIDKLCTDCRCDIEIKKRYALLEAVKLIKPLL